LQTNTEFDLAATQVNPMARIRLGRGERTGLIAEPSARIEPVAAIAGSVSRPADPGAAARAGPSLAQRQLLAPKRT
jgi:hypothetical protein